MSGSSRIRQLAGRFETRGIDALLVTKDVNITYLTGFPSSESWLLVGKRRAVYITDFRYWEEARRGLKGVGVRRYTVSIYGGLMDEVSRMRAKTVGIDTRQITLAQYRELQRHAPKGVKFVKADQMVEDLRAVKDKSELGKIRTALALHKETHQFLKKTIKPSITESTLLSKVETFVRARGAGFSFDPIIASGAHSSLPHAKVTERKLRRGEPVLIDLGLDVEGYKSDLTRMFFLGKIPALVRQVYDAVHAAQRAAIQGIKAGVPANEIDDLARNSLRKQKLEKYFGHALGHGVGLEVHESPRLAKKDTSVLKEGMVLTVEPGVYIPGKFGIRIEDMVLVRQKNCEILSDDIH